MTTQIIERYHDISCGHRVAGHESKCAHLHGHNYRVTFYCSADQLDSLGRIIDFSVMKERLCMWLESKWDHRFLYWENDPVFDWLDAALERKSKQMAYQENPDWDKSAASFVRLPFNPTAENMADYLLKTIGPIQLEGTGVRLVAVKVEETRKCSAVSVEEGLA